MWLICGLGNIGNEYDKTRHNIGFEFIDFLKDEVIRSQKPFKEKFKMEFVQEKLFDEEIILAKPQTYMNLSGSAVLEIVQFYKIEPKKIIVIHDDLDLKFGDIRSKVGGGHAGHNGLRDIDNKIGKEYYRIRVGIGHPRDYDTPQIDVANYVLQRFSGEEQKEIDEFVLGKVLDKLEEVMKK
jgi:PTH1 family peptidyl-tRNA hydrolase